MYKLSYEKCVVCFLFLVMVAILSCSGFRIDNNHLTTYSQTNNFTNNNTDAMMAADRNNLNAAKSDLSDNSVVINSARQVRTRWYKDIERSRRTRHRIRHHHRVRPTSRIDMFVRMPSPSITPDDGLQALPATLGTPLMRQIPAYSHPLQPTQVLSHFASYIQPKRSQRSPPHSGRRNQGGGGGGGNKRAKNCQEQDVARKAYIANTVVLAKAESMSANRSRNYSVSFRIISRFKIPDYVDVGDNLRLTFMNDTKRMNCESELYGGESGVVKAQIKQSKAYYLFLNTGGNHNYTVVGTPVLSRGKRRATIEAILAEVTRRTFVPRLKKPALMYMSGAVEPRTKVRLICKAKGYPIPIIEWRKNGTVLHSNSKIRITYRAQEFSDRRNSTLVIKSADEHDSGRYLCIAHGVYNGNQTTESYSADLRISNSNSHEEKCPNNEFCLNGGICKFNTDIKEYYCICSDGYNGSRCNQKTIGELPQSSKFYNSTCEKHGVPANRCHL